MPRLNQKQLAEKWGVHPSAVSKMLKAPDAPVRGRDGKYDEVACERYRLKRLSADMKSSTAEPGSLNDARRRKLDLECQKIEIEIQRIMDKLIPVEEHHSTLLEHAAIVKLNLLAFPKEVAAITRNAEQMKMAEQAVDKILTQLANAFDAAGETP